MKIERIILAASALAFAASASAGTVGAGPAGTGSTLVGSAVTTGSVADAALHSFTPGMIGTVMLAPDQAVAIAAYLKSQSGSVVNGDVVTCPTRFADDTDGLITLDTATGTLTLSRV